MGQSSHFGVGLSTSQAKSFRLTVSAACRRMTADQILDLADHLHDIMRKRSSQIACRHFGICEAGEHHSVQDKLL